MELLKKSEALCLAELLERGPRRSGDVAIATELRRLHAINVALLEAMRVFVSCQYPVSTEIDESGHSWSTAYLDQALPIARAAIAKAEAV